MAVQIVSASTLGATGRAVIRTSGGVIYVVVVNTGTLQIYKSSNGTSWTQQDVAHSPSADSSTPAACAIDSTGTIHITFCVASGSIDNLWYTTYSTSTDLFSGTLTKIITTALNSGIVNVAIAVDSNDIPHALISGGTSSNARVYYANKVGGTWNTAVNVLNSAGTSGFADILIDNNNIPEIVTNFMNNSFNSIDNAFLGSANNATSFTSKTLQTIVGGAPSDSVSIAMDSSNNTWVAFVDGNGFINIQEHISGNSWATWQTAITNSDAIGVGLSIVANGTNIYTFYDTSGGSIYYDEYNGSWLGATLLESGTDLLTPLGKWAKYNDNGASNQIDFVYHASNGTNDIYYWDKIAFAVVPTYFEHNTISQPFFTPYDVNQIVWPANPATYFKKPIAVVISSSTISQPVGNVGILMLQASTADTYSQPPTQPVGAASWLDDTVNQPYFTPYDVNQIVCPPNPATYFKAPLPPKGEAAWLDDTVSQPLFLPLQTWLFSADWNFLPTSLIPRIKNSTLALTTKLETPRNLGLAIFPSGGGYVDVPYASSLHPTDVITVAITGYSTNWSSITSKANLAGYAVSNTGFAFDINDSPGDGRLWFKLHRGGAYVLLGVQLSVLSAGQHRFVGTFDGRFTKFYLDGVLQQTDDFGSTTTIDQSTNDLAIGDNMLSGSTPEGNAFNNGIDEFLLVHAAWIQTDVNNDYGNVGGNPMNRRTPANIPGLVVGMHFDDSTANDFSGNGNNGTVQGSATYALGWHVLNPPVALLTTLEIAPKKKTLALKTTLQSSVQSSTVAILTTLFVATQSTTLALLTNIVYRGAATIALITTLERVSKVQYPRGITLSGLEFNNVIPGSLNTDYFESAQTTYDYFDAKGFPLIRLPILWERIQPGLNSALDATYKSYIDASIQEAANDGQSIILDIHNFGRRVVINPGGFSLLTSGTTDPMFQGNYTLASGVMTYTEFQRIYAGAYNNPVSPATTYAFQVDFQITSDDGNSFDGLWMEFFRKDDNNRYYIVLNHESNQVQLFKVVNGTTTQLGGNVSQTINLNTYYTVNIDVGQTTPHTVTVAFNGSQIFSQTLDVNLTAGFVAFWGNGTNGSIRNFTLNVNGDTTSGRTGSGNFRIGDAGLTTANFADLWTKLATAYKSNAQVYGYDVMNEAHDMPIPTHTATSPITLTSVTQTGNVATATSPSAHGYYAGDLITISGASQSQYNGTFTIQSVPTTVTFTYNITGNPASPATGTIQSTSPANYNTTSSVTNMNQAAINAIRAVDKHKWIFAENDSYAGAQQFVNMYGSNPTPYYTDPSHKTVYVVHYYFDNDHSGTYQLPFSNSNYTAISGDVTPFFSWIQANGLWGMLGEYGAPNTSPWQVCITAVLDLANTYGIWALHWAAGDHYTSVTQLNPVTYGPPIVDNYQMAAVGRTTYLGMNLDMGTIALFTRLEATNNNINLQQDAVWSAPSLGTLFGSPTASWNTAGYLELTSATNSQNGGIDFTGTIPSSVIISFDFWTGGGSGADAVWFYYGASTQVASEDNAQGGYAFAYDEYSGDNAPLQIRFNTSQIANTTGSATFADSNWHKAKIIISGTQITMYLDNVQTLQFVDTTRSLGGNHYGLGARTGGLNNEHRVRNLVINTPNNTLALSTTLSKLVSKTLALSTTLEAIVPTYAGLDQQSTLTGAPLTFGTFNGVRYAGFGFTPNNTGYLREIGFQRNVGTQDIKIYIDKAHSDSTPVDPVGSELYSFTVANASLTGNFQVFTLPTPLYVVAGQIYCIYIAPWSITNSQYTNDPEAMSFSSGGYSGGQEITNTNGTWSNQNLTPQYALYIQVGSNIALSVTLEKIQVKSTLALFADFWYQSQKTLALKTTLSAPGTLTLALLTILETAKQNSTVALLTLLETADKFSTVALSTTLETYQTRRYKYALQFDGSQNWVSVNDNASLDFTGNFTVEAQIIHTGGAGTQRTIVRKGSQYILRVSSLKIQGVIWTANNSALQVNESVNLVAGQHHVAITYDGATFRVYRDGNLVASHAATGATQTGTSVLGIGATGASTEPFGGTIDEIRISNVARYTGSTYTVPANDFVVDANTQALWHFDEGTGTTAHDVSGNNNTGTLSGSPVPLWVNGLISPLENIALITTLQSANQYITLALNTTLETAAININIALSTTLETAGNKSTLALKTTLETTNLYSTLALKTTLEVIPHYSTVALKTILEKFLQSSTVALKTTLETANKFSTVALKTTLETAGNKSTVALRTTLEVIPQKSTVALKTVLETANQFSTVALKTTLETANKFSTVALLTTLSKPAQKTLALLTTFEEITKKTLALFTSFQSVANSTVALSATLEKTHVNSTLALSTTLETTKLYSTVALKTTLQSANQFSTLALKTTLESAKQFSTVALKTTLESAKQYSTVALRTTLQAKAQGTVAILTLFLESGLQTLALKTQLDPALRFSTVALFTDFNHLTTSHPIALNTSLNRAGKVTLALTAPLLHFIGWHNDDFGHLGWEGSSHDEVPVPTFGLAQDGHPLPPTGGFVDDGSVW